MNFADKKKKKKEKFKKKKKKNATKIDDIEINKILVSKEEPYATKKFIQILYLI